MLPKRTEIDGQCHEIVRICHRRRGTLPSARSAGACRACASSGAQPPCGAERLDPIGLSCAPQRPKTHESWGSNKPLSRSPVGVPKTGAPINRSAEPWAIEGKQGAV